MKSSPVITVLVAIMPAVHAADSQWALHVIDNASRGADGVRLGDVNRDGKTDIVTGWEEGGRIRICCQPALSEITEKWPSTTIGAVKSPEDAVFADLNGDNWLDVVSCCEGKEQRVFFHYSPGRKDAVHSSDKWKTEELPGTAGVTRWMFCEPLQDDTLVLGSKAPNAQITLWQAGRLRILRDCGWIMSLRRFDFDGDGDDDILYSDRKGKNTGVGWLENPGQPDQQWPDHSIGGKGLQVMFLDIMSDASATAPSSQTAETITVACNVSNGPILLMTPETDVARPWKVQSVPQPEGTGSGKGVAFADVNDDGRTDLVCTCEKAEKKSGVFWLERLPPRSETGNWKFHDISGKSQGIKYDRIEMIDLDQDGDLDLMTCEERDNLGVIWYENPHKP